MEFLDPVMPYIEPVWAWLMNGVETFGPDKGDGTVNWLFLALDDVLFPAYLEAYMQPIWTDGLGFTLYEWKENPSAPLNLPDTAVPDNTDTEESN